MFSQSIEELRKQILQHKQKQHTKNIYSLKWLILSKAIQPSKLTYSDIEYELNKNRIMFKQLYMDYQRSGKFMHELDDIIVKDVRRLDQNMILNIDFTSVWPKLNATGFKNCVMIITRIIIRYDMPSWSTSQYSAEYFQGMHEIIAFILYIFINQLSTLKLQDINATNGCISCKLHNIMADAYLLSKHVLKNILPLFQDNECLEDVCQNIYRYIKTHNDKFYNEIQKQIKELPPIITFAQKSIKLIFLRDFDLLQHMKHVWDYIFAFDSFYLLADDQKYQFLSYLLGDLYIWRYTNRDKLKLNEFINVFLEQNLLFPQNCDLETFLMNVVNSYSKIIDITSMTSIHKSVKCVESSDGVQNNFNTDDIDNIKGLFEKNKQVIQEINNVIEKLQLQDTDEQATNILSLCQNAINILNNERDSMQISSTQDEGETCGRVHTFGDLLGEYRRLLCLRQFTE